MKISVALYEDNGDLADDSGIIVPDAKANEAWEAVLEVLKRFGTGTSYDAYAENL